MSTNNQGGEMAGFAPDSEGYDPPATAETRSSVACPGWGEGMDNTFPDLL